MQIPVGLTLILWFESPPLSQGRFSGALGIVAETVGATAHSLGGVLAFATLVTASPEPDPESAAETVGTIPRPVLQLQLHVPLPLPLVPVAALAIPVEAVGMLKSL